jgi:hypothetical protein
MPVYLKLDMLLGNTRASPGSIGLPCVCAQSLQTPSALSSRSATMVIEKLLSKSSMGYDSLLWVFAGLVVFGFAISLRTNNREHYGANILRRGVFRVFQATRFIGTG